MDSSAVAIIPARGGSKRIPRKNVRDFCGRPIIGYSIAAAIDSGCFREVMVSTDDVEIAEISRSLGASVPFLRSPQNSDDYSGIDDVAIEVVKTYLDRKVAFEYVCILLPTAPFITKERLEQGFSLLRNRRAGIVVPVVRYSYPIQRALKLDFQGNISMVSPEFYDSRSQDLSPTFHDCGQFYWMTSAALLDRTNFFGGCSVALEIPDSEVQDIDTAEDWRQAELKFRLLKNIIA